MLDLSHASGVTLRGPIRGRIDYGGYENQRKTYGVVAFEALNQHGLWETLWDGNEREAAKFLKSAKRLIDIGKETPYSISTSLPSTRSSGPPPA